MTRCIICFVSLLFFISCKDGSNKTEDIQDKESYDLVLLNGNVINIETGEITTSSIFINDSQIVKIISSDLEYNYGGGQVLDVSGKYILPGYWDNHVHFRGGDSLIEENKGFLKLFIANGITTVRDAGGDLTPAVMQWREQINNGDLIGPTIFTSGPKIDGKNARWEGSIAVESDEQIAQALDSLESINVDFVKLYDSTISADAYLQAIRESEKRNMITSGHMPFTVTLDETVDAGLDAVEHLYYILKGCSSKEESITLAVKNKEYGFWDSMSKLIASYSDLTAHNTFQNLKENEVYVVPTLHIGNVLSYLDEQDHSKDMYLKFLSDGFIKTYQGRINNALNASEKSKRERKELNSFFKELTKKLHDAEVNILAGSDSGAFNSYTYPGISLHQELEALVMAGLTPLEALRTSAYNGSKFLKQDSDYGTVSIGKFADLVILNANPLENISESNNINIVIKHGRIIDTSNMLD